MKTENGSGNLDTQPNKKNSTKNRWKANSNSNTVGAKKTPQQAKAVADNKQKQKQQSNKNSAQKPAKNVQKSSGQKAKQNYNRQGKKNQPKNKQNPKKKLKIIPLGGLNEIGKNMTAYEYGNEIFIVDCGIAFPDSTMLGVDVVIPDMTYVEQNKKKIRGLVITHGHEDHIGGIPYFLRKLNVPIYGTRLTAGLITRKLDEHKLTKTTKLNIVKAGDVIKLGCFSIEFIRVNHSIPDAAGLAITTPVGVVIQTGDFKIDYTPVDGKMTDLARFAQYGSKGVLALLSDSTNAERPGSSMSEKAIGQNLFSLFERGQDKRIIVASFASNIHRVQQIIDCARRSGRKVALSGRSMINVVEVAKSLGYIKAPNNIFIDIRNVNKFKKSEVCLITTGSQGEALSALTRMSNCEHRQVKVSEDDLIIISASPIPGNEKLVSGVVNDLLRLGADVIYEKMYEVHVSGHASQDELRTMMGLVKPKFFVPVHGEFKHMRRHAQLAEEMGIEKKNILIADIGAIIEIDNNKIKSDSLVEAGSIMIDGIVGDVGSVVLKDRKHLSEDGIIVVAIAVDTYSGSIVSGPDIESRGFVFVKESGEIILQAKEAASNAVKNYTFVKAKDFPAIKIKLRDSVSNIMYRKTKRRPMVVPIILEV